MLPRIYLSLVRHGTSKLLPHKQSCRPLTTTTLNDPAKIRNMALVAHIDSGKTTLTESILYTSSYLAVPGSVDTGSTTTDFLPAERERGITIQSASIPVKWKDWTFNLVDTPGHADFGMEVESASRVVDGAVVLIDSVEGVEAQTKGVWRQLDRYGVPTRIMFLNKLDRPGASFRSSVLSLLSHRLHAKPTPLILPIASFESNDYSRGEPGVQGLVDLVKWEIWKWDSEGQPSRHSLPRKVDELGRLEILPASHPIIPHLVEARTSLLENISMFSEDFMESLLALPSDPSAYLTVETASIMPHLRALTLRNEILPVLCGAAAKGIGTDLVLDYAGELLASPLDVPHDIQSSNAPLRMLAWKVSWDKRRGWLTFVRVYSGTLKRQSVIFNSTRNERERVSKLLLLYASQAEEVEELPFGSVGVIVGLKYTRTGDTLVSSGNQKASGISSLRDITPPPAVMSTSIIPQSHADLEPVQEALKSLSRTDPSVRIELQEGQILVHGLGALHLEIVEGRLRDEWNAHFEFGRRRVSYREGLGSGSQESQTWRTDISGKPVVISIDMEVQPLGDGEKGDPVWDDNVVLGPKGDPLPSPESFPDQTHPLAHIARGVSSTLSSSPNSSLPLSHLRIKIVGFRHPNDTPIHVLTGASAVILRNRLREAGMGPVMEPYIRLKVTVNEDSLGKVVQDLTENGAEISDLGSDSNAAVDVDEELGPFTSEGVYIPPDWLSPNTASSQSGVKGAARLRRSIHCLAPLSKMLDYSTRLRALSGGHGQFEMMNAGFREVSNSRQLEILKEIGRA